jgi:hypothetical protein
MVLYTEDCAFLPVRIDEEKARDDCDNAETDNIASTEG